MVVVCGAGQWQSFIIQYFIRLEKELCIIAPENNLNFTPKIFIQEDLRNDKIIVEKLLIYKKSIELVFSDQSDLGIRLVSIINEKLNLKGLLHEQTKWFYNKYYFNKLLDSETSQNTKQSFLINSEIELRDILSKEGKLVLKPCDSQSSKGVTLVDEKSNLSELISEAKKHSLSGQIIAESFVSGKEYTVEAIVLDGVLEVLAISKKEHLSFGIANVLFYSVEYKELFDKLNTILSRICVKTKLLNSMLHGEFILDGDVVTMIELACRGGGTNISGVILKSLLGYSPVYKVIENITGETHIESGTEKLNYVGLFFFTFQNSPLNNLLIDYLVNLDNDPRVLEMSIEIDVNNDIRKVVDDRSRHGYIVLGSNDRGEIDSLVEVINSKCGYEIIKETFG